MQISAARVVRRLRVLVALCIVLGLFLVVWGSALSRLDHTTRTAGAIVGASLGVVGLSLGGPLVAFRNLGRAAPATEEAKALCDSVAKSVLVHTVIVGVLIALSIAAWIATNF